MPASRDAYSRYLPTSPEAEKWGLFVTDCGFTRIVPGSPYPPGPHPPEYSLDGLAGRVLQEYQVVYITAGKGWFQSGCGRSRVVVPGTVLLLFPGVPHRYCPDHDTGWDEFWVGFNGTYARTLMRPPFFSPDEPLFRIGLHEQLLEIFLEIADLTQTEPFGFRNVIASKTSEILAAIHARSRRPNLTLDARDERIREACCHMLEHVSDPVDFHKLARRLGLSYATFRRVFRQYTGLPPNQYLLNLRIHKAKALLGNSRMPVKEIAEATGFDSIYYFSRLFKQKTGMAPIQWRSPPQITWKGT